MNTPSSKRRRVDAAAALSKPFKSPLRRPATNTDDTPSKPVTSGTENARVPATLTIPVESKSTSQSNPTTPVPPKRKRMSQPFSPFPSQSFQTSDPEILELQKQHRAIQSKVDALITKLEIATQAFNLETNPKYIEIPTLITKWRLASQDAADEVFVGAKERFNHMGGMSAWKERSKRDATRWEFDEENRQGEHVDEDEGDVDNYDAKDSSGNLPNKNNDEEESQDEEFTMEFMLKSLHIDPKLIGYDIKAQRWIKS